MEKREERRLNPRSEVDWPIHIFVDNDIIEGELKNISLDGLYISCDQPLRIQTKYRMSILPPASPSIDVTGQIVWSDLYGLDGEKAVYGIGVCLIEIIKEDKHAIGELIGHFL